MPIVYCHWESCLYNSKGQCICNAIELTSVYPEKTCYQSIGGKKECNIFECTLNQDGKCGRKNNEPHIVKVGIVTNPTVTTRLDCARYTARA
jgi:hypothetical protein